MAIQQWTIIKLVGPAAKGASNLFDNWWAARRSADMECFATEDWHNATRRAVAKYLDKIDENRFDSPVMYFSKHVDLWLTHGQVQLHLPKTRARVLHDKGELWCYRMPDRGHLIRRNKALTADQNSAETQWLATRLIEAAKAFNKLWPEAIVLVNRNSIGVSPTDKELIASAKKPPAWMADRR